MHGVFTNKMFKSPAYINDQLYEEFVKMEIEHKEPKIVGFFILQFAKLRMPELYYIFFDKNCDVTKFEQLETNTDSLYLALSEPAFYVCIQPAMKKE